MKRVRFTIERQKGLMGILFLLPWLIGFVFLFAFPLIQSFRYSLSDMQLTPTGLSIRYGGLINYQFALLEHPTFNRTLTEAVMQMVVDVPLIIFFSLFSATLLNQKFRGRVIARAIFFLPVILASGVISNLSATDFMSQLISEATHSGGGGDGSLLKSFELERMLVESGLSPTIINYLTGSVNRIYEVISASGVQILIFLAGLQSISPSLYEASKIEGATGYETFWKITFPMVSPLILTNVLYTVIDSFTKNKMTTLIQQTAFGKFNFGLSSAMAWMYFLIIGVCLIIVAMLISRKVFYYD